MLPRGENCRTKIHSAQIAETDRVKIDAIVSQGRMFGLSDRCRTMEICLNNDMQFRNRVGQKDCVLKRFTTICSLSEAKFAAVGLTCLRRVPDFLANPEISLKSGFWFFANLSLRKVEPSALLVDGEAITIRLQVAGLVRRC